MPQNVSNRIEAKIDDMTEKLAVIETKVETTIKKQEYTNGKVAGLIEDKIRREEREKTLREMGSKNTTVINAPNATSISPRLEKDTLNKLVVSVSAVLAAVAMVLGSIFGGGIK